MKLLHDEVQFLPKILNDLYDLGKLLNLPNFISSSVNRG